jgi:very-short-patch-repair endonuclease
LWGLLKGSAPPPEVRTPTERRIKGITIHRTRGPIEATTRKQIPTTTVPRTLVDLAGSLPLDALARACHEAQVKHDTTPTQIQQILSRRPSTPGSGKLKTILSGESPVTLSALERRFVHVLKQEGLPLPQTNRRAGAHYVDCRWPDHHLTVELDGFRFHNSRHTWELDRRREREAYARGDQHRRYTYADVFEDQAAMLLELHERLRGWRHANPAGRRPG